MRRSLITGCAIGLLAGLVSVVSNLWRNDPHRVTFAPDLISAVVVAGLVIAAVRLASKRGAALREVMVAAATICGIVTGLFAWLWMPTAPVALALVVAVGSFAFMLVLSGIASLSV